MNRDDGDKDVAVRETKALQETFDNKVQRLSFFKEKCRPRFHHERIHDRLNSFSSKTQNRTIRLIQSSEAGE